MKHVKLFEGFVNENKIEEMATVHGDPGMSVNHQHDYSTLKTPWGNYTQSYGGVKLSGQLAGIKGLMKRLDDYIKDPKNGAKLGERMEKLMREFKTVVPEVLDFEKPEDLEEGDVVTVEGEFKRKYPNEYVVYKTSKKFGYIKLPDGSGMGIPVYALKRTGRKDAAVAQRAEEIRAGFNVGDTVKIDPKHKDAARQYPGEYVVASKIRDKYKLTIPGRGLLRIPASMLVLVRSKNQK